MTSKWNFLITGIIAVMALMSPQIASAENLAFGKSYAYFLTVPGEPQNNYFDDPHAVHPSNLGAYDTGDLTDGVVYSGNSAQLVGFWGDPGDTPPVEIIFDLGADADIGKIVVGNGTRACCGSSQPDDVSLSYAKNTSPGTFFGDQNHVLWTSDQTPEGHYEMTLSVKPPVTARYVKLSFDGGTPPGGHNKYMLDEIEILRAVPPPPYHSVPTMPVWALVLTGLLLILLVRRRLVI